MAQQKYETTVEWKRGKPIVSDFALQNYINMLTEARESARKAEARALRKADAAENKWKEWARRETASMKQGIITLANDYADYWRLDD